MCVRTRRTSYTWLASKGFKGSRVQGFKGSRVQGFKGSRVQRFKVQGSRLRVLTGYEATGVLCGVRDRVVVSPGRPESAVRPCVSRGLGRSVHGRPGGFG